MNAWCKERQEEEAQRRAEAYSGVYDALQGLEKDDGVSGLAAGDPVVVVVLCQLVDLLQRQAAAHAPQVRRDVKALQPAHLGLRPALCTLLLWHLNKPPEEPLLASCSCFDPVAHHSLQHCGSQRAQNVAR